MAYFRFHKSRKIAPGVRLNMSKSGPSVSVGVPGLRYNIGPQGTRTTLGIPGTGLSVIDRSSWTKRQRAAALVAEWEASKGRKMGEKPTFAQKAQKVADVSTTICILLLMALVAFIVLGVLAALVF